MSEKEKAKKEEIEQNEDNNLVGFLELLLKVDMRNNPDDYKSDKEENDRHSSINN